VKVASAAFLDGYYLQASSDWELLEQYHEGIIATTGCLGGLVSQLVLADQLQAAYEAAARFQDIFGRDNYFVEIQDHGIEDQKRTIGPLLDIARKLPRAAARHQRLALHHQGRRRRARRVAVRADRVAQERHEAPQVFDGEDFYIKVVGRDARPVRRAA